MAVVSRVATLTFSGATGSRTWQATATQQDTAAGALVTINFVQSTTGASPPGTANATRELILKNDAGTTIRTFTWAEGAASDTFQFYLTSDGINGSSARCGTVGMTLKVVKTNGGPTATYDAESDGAPNTPPTGFTTTQADVGWIRGTTTAMVVVNKTALGDPAFTGTYAYPDSLFVRTTLGAQAYVAARTITNAVGAILTNAVAGSGTNYDSTFTQAVDARFSVGSHSATVSTVANATLTGLPWTVLTTTPQPLTVDARVTLSNLVSTSGGLAKVYNRGETATGTIEVRNARSESFTPRGTATLTSIDVGSGVENSVSFSRAGAVYTWTSVFATSGNVAPATDAGSAKGLRWRDSPANSPTPAESATYGLLSSKLNVTVHLQERQTALNPALDTDQRLQANIGYYGVKVANVRGEAYNGAQGQLSLRPDDDSLAGVVTATLTTATINTHPGYTPLTTWTDPLPGGGWDIWASTSFTKDGNTGEKARSGTDVYDVLLVAADPNVAGVLVIGSDDPDNHITPGVTLEIDATLTNQETHRIVESDSARLIFRRTNGPREWQFYDAGGVWTDDFPTPNVPVTAAPIPMTQNPDDFGLRLDVVTDDTWANNFEVIVVFTKSGVNYRARHFVDLVSEANSHAAYKFDPTGLFK